MIAARHAPIAAAIDSDGWLTGVRRVPSPNFDRRPDGVAVDLLVIHNISLPPGEFGGGNIERLFTNQLDPAQHSFFSALRKTRVSSHFLIERNGRITQFVSCADRAWHAGASVFDGRARCNDFSLGIELEGTDFVAFAGAQYASVARLTRALRRRYALRAVRGHQHIAVERKTDPGPFFDWARFGRAARLPAALLPAQHGG